MSLAVVNFTASDPAFVASEPPTAAAAELTCAKVGRNVCTVKADSSHIGMETDGSQAAVVWTRVDGAAGGSADSFDSVSIESTTVAAAEVCVASVPCCCIGIGASFDVPTPSNRCVVDIAAVGAV